jgi:hypothetical protein
MYVHKSRDINKKFSEELIAYFPFTIILVSDKTCTKKTWVHIHNEVKKTIQYWRLQCFYYWWSWFMRYTVGMASDGITCKPKFMNIGLDIQVILRLIHWQFQRFESVATTNENNLLCALVSGGMIYITSFTSICTGVEGILTIFLSHLKGCNVGITDCGDL